jgi:phage baseplate assembly protein W
MARTSVYSDVDIELSKQTDGDVTKETNLDAIINSLTNIVATMQGSRRMLPEFAQDLWNLLFEPLDDETARQIGERLLEAVRIWDNRVEVTLINMSPDYDQNTYKCSMNFRIKTIRQEVEETEQTIDFVLYAQ